MHFPRFYPPLGSSRFLFWYWQLEALIVGYSFAVVAASFVAIGVLLARALGVRKGAWAAVAKRRPRLARALAWVPGAIWTYLAGVPTLEAIHTMQPSSVPYDDLMMWGNFALVLVGALGMTAVSRFALKRAADVAPEQEAPALDADPQETVFSAIAVTRTTRAAVGFVAALPFALLATIFLTPLPESLHAIAVVAYLATTFATVAAVRRASRIKVGLDGVYVMGSGPATFHAWAGLDGVRAEGVDIVLTRGERVVLRLQLHGADSARSDALVARFQASMAAAARTRTDAPHVHAAHAARAAAAGSARFVAAAHGATDYRAPAVSREQLWEVVEGPAAEAPARVLAAEAIAASMDDGERARLRVAAEHCAEPRLLIALERVLHDREDDEDAEDAPPARTGAAHLPR